MQRIFLLGAAVVVLMWVGGAAAAPPQLKGDYAVTGEMTCMNSPGNFHSDFTPIGPAAVSSLSVVGIRTFNGDGKGTAHVRTVSITHPPATFASAESSDATFKFTYSVTKEGFITARALEPVTGKILTGPNANDTFTEDGFSLSGWVSEDGKTVMLATTEPEVITHTITHTTSTGVSTSEVIYQICHRSRVLTRLDE